MCDMRTENDRLFPPFYIPPLPLGGDDRISFEGGKIKLTLWGAAGEFS